MKLHRLQQISPHFFEKPIPSSALFIAYCIKLVYLPTIEWTFPTLGHPVLFLDILSWSDVSGIPYFLDASGTLIPAFFTSCRALCIAFSVYFFGVDILAVSNNYFQVISSLRQPICDVIHLIYDMDCLDHHDYNLHVHVFGNYILKFKYPLTDLLISHTNFEKAATEIKEC